MLSRIALRTGELPMGWRRRTAGCCVLVLGALQCWRVKPGRHHSQPGQ